MILLLVLVLMITAGCWSRKEVEDLAIVSAIGVDRVEIEGRPLWRLTFEVFLPRSFGANSGRGGGGDSAPASWIVSSFGETLQDAIVNFNTRTPRRILLAHSNVIVIGEETARSSSLHEISDFLLRTKDLRLRNWFLVTEGTAEAMLTASWELEQDLATELLNLIELTSLEQVVVPRGYRLLSKIPRLPASIMENLIDVFQKLPFIMEATLEDLDEVEGIGEVRARQIKKGIRQYREQIWLERQL